MNQATAIIGLLVFAWAIRWPYLQTVPAFTDEMDEILYSVPTMLGGPAPLVGISTFDGAMYTRTLAMILQVSQQQWEVPRLLSWFCGGLTVAATYLMARLAGGHRVGLIAGVLMAIAPAHILINSRVGWSHSITPLFSTFGLALLMLAIRLRRTLAFVAAGIIGGIALQSHASTVALAPGLFWALASTRAWSGIGRGFLLAGCMVVLMETPVIAYNITSGFESFRFAAEHRRQEDKAVSMTPVRYAGNLGLFTKGLTETLSGSMRDRDETQPTNAAPVVILGSGLGIVGIVGLIWKQKWLLLAPCLSFALILPLMNSGYEPTIMNARYFMPILPMLFTGIALITATLIRSAHLWHRQVMVFGAIAAVVGAELGGTALYVQSALGRGMSNDDVITATGALLNHDSQPVLLDESLNSINTLGGGRVLKSLMVLLNLNHTAYRIAGPDDLASLIPPGTSRIATLTTATAASLRRRASDFKLRIAPLAHTEGEIISSDKYGVYTLTRDIAGRLEYDRCYDARVEHWAREPGMTRVTLAGAPFSLTLDTNAKTRSIALRELDRVQRPAGQWLSVCPGAKTDFSSSADIPIREPQELIFYAFN